MCSVQGYGKVGGGWLYPGSGATSDTRPPLVPDAPGATKAAANAEEAAAGIPAAPPQQPAAPDTDGMTLSCSPLSTHKQCVGVTATISMCCAAVKSKARRFLGGSIKMIGLPASW